jgi:periplasmic divalent cation tolerance protein
VAASSELIIVLCTAPDAATAERLARGLVEAKLAACVNAIAGLKSFYRWKGQIEADDEVQLLIKTRSERFDAVTAWIADNHPYDVPEVIALSAERVDEAYLRWAIDQTR